MAGSSRPLSGRAVVACALVALSVAGCGGGHAAQRPARPGAVVVAERQVGPRLVDLRVRSPALRRVASVRLLTPVGWRPRSARRWPVLFLLHGCCDDYRAWSRSTDIGTLTRLRRVLVVMPEGGDAGFYSDWHGGARTQWETFHTRELPALLAARFGAGRARAIAGLSMGGLGAMDYAARHRGLFRSAASFSGVLHPRADPRFWTGLFTQYQSANDVWGDPVADRGVWAAHDPTSLAGRLRGVGLFVSSGDRHGGDPIEAVVGRESRAFVDRLRSEGVGVRADLYRGGRHNWRYWQRELHRALPTLLTPLGV